MSAEKLINDTANKVIAVMRANKHYLDAKTVREIEAAIEQGIRPLVTIAEKVVDLSPALAGKSRHPVVVAAKKALE